MYFRLSERLSSDGITIAADSHKHRVREKEFKMISDWYHYAFLELFLILPYPVCLKTCSERLDISLAEVSNAADRLLKLKFLKKDKRGHLVLNVADSSTVGTVPSTEIHRKLQKTYLEKSAEALALCSPEIRDHSGITLAIHRNDLPKAKKLLKDLRRHFNAEMQSRNDFTDVYQLQVSFYPLEKKGLLS